VSEAGQDEYVTIARVLRSRGNRGEVAADDLSDRNERFVESARVLLVGPAGEHKTGGRREMVIEHSWYHQGRLILKFEGVDSISDAELLRGSEVQIPRGELGAPPEGEYFYDDLIGTKVLDADSGREIGEVEGVLEAGGTLLLEVSSSGGEVLIPFVKHICIEIAPENGVIRVRMPEGLEELNS
jgi:16S rRNA processing protein RimM